jgi:RNA polymerase sigma factor (sigma-70 family)
LDDHSIIEKVLNGDIEVFSILVEKYKDLIYSIAYRITENPEDAKDIVQDTFLKAFKALKSYRKESKFPNWIYRIAYTTSISKKRTFKFNLDFMYEENEIVDFNQLDEIFTKLCHIDQDKIVKSALDQLKVDERLLLTLFYYNDCSVNEISSITGLKRSNVKVKIFRIRKKLYQFIILHYSELQSEML